MIGETFDATDEWRVDPEALEWQDLAACHGVETNMFYDFYEADETTAHNTDSICRSCPVRKQCLTYGVENSEWGVWGGVYLVGGKTDVNRNAHKTDEDWDEVRRSLSE